MRSTVSHEIWNLLSVLKVGVDTLETGRVGQFMRKEGEIIQVLKRNIKKLESLINQGIPS